MVSWRGAATALASRNPAALGEEWFNGRGINGNNPDELDRSGQSIGFHRCLPKGDIKVTYGLANSPYSADINALDVAKR